MTELKNPTMFFCVFHNQTIYYSMISLKVYNHLSQKINHVERKLPPIVGRYFLLFRSMVQWYSETLYKNHNGNDMDDYDDDEEEEDDEDDDVHVIDDNDEDYFNGGVTINRMIPSRIDRPKSGPTKFGPANIMQQIFNLGTLPLRRRSRPL